MLTVPLIIFAAVIVISHRDNGREKCQRIQNGMTEEQVLAIMGKQSDPVTRHVLPFFLRPHKEASWSFDDAAIIVEFNKEGRVTGRIIIEFPTLADQIQSRAAF